MNGSQNNDTRIMASEPRASSKGKATEVDDEFGNDATLAISQDASLIEDQTEKTRTYQRDTLGRKQGEESGSGKHLAGAGKAAHEAIMVGDCLNNRFTLDDILGSGGMGEVFRAKDLRRVEASDNNPYIALKLLRPEFRSHTKFMIALQRESKKVQKLSHPNIVTMYDFDRDGSTAYITMEYLQGQSLDKVIKKNALTTKEAMYVIDRMARGLAFAHQEGYVHADFKPANIFFTNNQQVKILDFGIAQAVKKIKGRYVNITDEDPTSTLYALTPNYASLEMLDGQQALPVDDVYSFCCVAYELLTGTHPFVDEAGRKVDAKQAFEQGLTPPDINNVPDYYAQALKKGLAFKRQGRLENAGQLLDAFKPKSTKKRVVALLASMVLLSVLYIGFGEWQSQRLPSLNSLSGPLVTSANMIREGDAMLAEGDIDLAHRFYTQAWNEGNDKKNNEGSISNLKRIVDNRMDKITKALFLKIEEQKLDQFSTQEINIALDFIRKSDLGTMDSKISNYLEKN